jgi:Co/Zn/Cd efflux system component
MTDANAALRGAVRLVALLNLAYFGIEFAVALEIGSVSLLADTPTTSRMQLSIS